MKKLAGGSKWKIGRVRGCKELQPPVWRSVLSELEPPEETCSGLLARSGVTSFSVLSAPFNAGSSLLHSETGKPRPL